MTELKTRPTGKSVTEFLEGVPDERRKDCKALMAILKRATGARPRMWGGSIVGYGDYRYKYASGREGDWFLAGLAPRKHEVTVYVCNGLDEPDLLARLGRFTSGKGCLHIKRFDDIDPRVLEQLIERSVAKLRARLP